jgi:predicted nucleic acid-binding protein
MIVFDTSAVIDFLRGGERTKAVIEAMEKSKDSLAMTSVSMFELLSPVDYRKLWHEGKTVRAFTQRTVML